MIRKLLGILVLMLIAIAGVAWVELSSRDSARDAKAETYSGTFYRIVVGGESARTEAPAAEESGPTPTSDSGVAPEVVGDDDEAGIEVEEAPVVRVPPEPPREFRYSVREGDSLVSIVRDHLGTDARATVDRVARENGIKNANALRIGDPLVIRVTKCDRHVANGKEGWRDLARKYYGVADRVSPLVRANPKARLDASGRLPTGALVFVPH